MPNGKAMLQYGFLQVCAKARFNLPESVAEKRISFFIAKE
jgi:hypothetical protein